MHRAEALDDAIDALLAGRGSLPPSELDELGPLLAEGRALLRSRPGEGSPSPTFLLGLEAQLVTDMRLQAPVLRRRPWRAAGAVVLATFGLLAAVLLGPANALLPARVTEPFHRAWEAVVLAAAPSPEERVRRLLGQGWRHLGIAEDAARTVPTQPALAHALEAAVGRYRLALAATEDDALDARVRSQAEAEVQLVMARLARQAHGRPEGDRALWVGARLALSRLLVANARVVHLPPSPRHAPADDVRILLPPAGNTAPPSASSTAVPTEAATPTVGAMEPTREAWPVETGAAPTESPTAPPAPSEPPPPVPATAERARPPATATPAAPTPSTPADPPSKAVTPTPDRWPTATPPSVDPGRSTPGGSPQPSLPPPSEPPPLVP